MASTIGDAASDMRGERRPPFRRRGVTRSTSTLAEGTASASSSRLLRLLALRSLLHRLLQVVISSQSFSHFFRHVNGRPHTTHVLVGRLCGLRNPAIAIVRRCTPTHGARLMKDGAAVATASSSLSMHRRFRAAPVPSGDFSRQLRSAVKSSPRVACPDRFRSASVGGWRHAVATLLI